MFLPLLPLEGQYSLQHSDPELQDRPNISVSTFAEDMELLHGDTPSSPESKKGDPSPSGTNTRNCHQPCPSKYYHSITPKTKIHPTQKRLKDGCLFSFFKSCARIPSSTPETAITTSSISERSSDAASLVSTTPSEDSKSPYGTDEALDHFTVLGEPRATPVVPDHWKSLKSQETDRTKLQPSDSEEETKVADKWEEAFESEVPEHVTPAESTMNGNVADHEESSFEVSAVHTPAALSFDSGSGPDGVPGAQLGTKLPTADPCSDDDILIPENLAQNLFIPIVKGNNFNHVDPFLTQQAGNLDSAEISAKEAPQARAVIEIEPAITEGHYQGHEDTLVDTTLSPDPDNTELQARQGSVEGSAFNHSILQDATPLFKSKETITGTSAAKVVEEPAKVPSTDVTSFPTLGIAEMPLIQNLKRPDMSWASDVPVAFTSSVPKSSVDKKLDELPARAEAALLRRQILRQYAAQREKQVEGEEAALTQAATAQEKVDSQVVPKSGKVSNRKKQRQAAKAKRQAFSESSVTVAITPYPPAPSSAVVAPTPELSQHTNAEKHNSVDGEFEVESRPSKRAQRAKAYAESKEKKAREQKAAQELKKLQEDEAAANVAAAPVLTTAAKRRNRQKRSDGGKSWADVLKS